MFISIISIITIIRNSSRVVIVFSYLPLSNLNPLSLIFHSVKWDGNPRYMAVIAPSFGNQMMVYVKEICKCVSFIQMLVITECYDSSTVTNPRDPAPSPLPHGTHMMFP